MKKGFTRRGLCGYLLASLLLVTLPQLAHAITPTVLTVPEVPGTPSTPHTTYPGASIVLGAEAPNVQGSSDTFNVVWSFGDGSPNVTFSFVGTATSAPYAYDISTPHTYSGGAGTTWVATVTVTDASTLQSGANTYLVLMEPNTLSSRVDVAIDNGLWYMHQTMWRTNTPANGQPVNWGGWDYISGSPGCNYVSGTIYDCDFYSGSSAIDASNVQAFEVNGHMASGPGSDPYTDDVARGLARLFYWLTPAGVAATTYTYNPATANYGCSSGYPTTTYPNCQPPATQVFYNPTSTSCPSPPCTFTFDGNSNTQALYVYTTYHQNYEGGQFIDAIVASGTPSATAPTGTGPSGGLPGVLGQTYKNIVQDMVDGFSYCQYPNDYDVSVGYTRGGSQDQGGAWLYGCQDGDDNSASQWSAIGLIAAFRGAGFNITTPPIVLDASNTWVTNSQDVQGQTAAPTGTDPWTAGDYLGSYGYRGAVIYSNAWGPFADTPSGLVQMALDGVGRTKNVVFGDPTTAPDQRWNNTETWYADNFCNDPSSGAYYAPRAYTYGMFSFTKSMLLHDPNGTLTPIKFMRTQTPGVFTSDQIDWYAALSPANGGVDPCDGIAQTLVERQGPYGYWWGYDYSGQQYPFETAWSIIMLRRTVFVSCVSNLYGRGTAGGPGHPARIDLTWGAQTGASSYAVLRGTVNGGPYTQIGTTTLPAYSDKSGLANGDTYYYVVQPLSGTTEVCQSNQATVTIPRGR